MDCPSEEQLIRMKLSDIQSVRQMNFDLINRSLTVIHEDNLDTIQSAIDSLNLNSKLSESANYEGEISSENERKDKRLLWTVLIINFAFFLIEIVFGIVASSVGLLADSLDMFADALVYGLSLYAITGTLLIKKRVARISGYTQLSFSIFGFIEVLRRFFGVEEIPNPTFMISISFLALLANTASLVLLNKSKTKEVHIQSSQIFTSNDIIANIGVIFAGTMVLFLNSNIPDLIVGTIVFFFVLRGAIRILELAK